MYIKSFSVTPYGWQPAVSRGDRVAAAQIACDKPQFTFREGSYHESVLGLEIDYDVIGCAPARASPAVPQRCALVVPRPSSSGSACSSSTAAGGRTVRCVWSFLELPFSLPQGSHFPANLAKRGPTLQTHLTVATPQPARDESAAASTRDVAVICAVELRSTGGGRA